MNSTNKKKDKPVGMRLAVILTVVALGILAAIVILNNQKETTVAETEQIDVSGQPTLGEAEAPVTIVEFGDFKCPSCKAWGETIHPQLVQDYIDTGKVKFSYINVLFHGEESIVGSLAAEAVYQQSPESYWDFHKALFAEQPTVDHDAAWLTPEKVVEVAKKFPAIDSEQLISKMEATAAKEAVEKDTQLVEEAGVAQTPTIVINGQIMEDPFDYDAIKAVIDKELEGES